MTNDHGGLLLGHCTCDDPVDFIANSGGVQKHIPSKHLQRGLTHSTAMFVKRA